MNPLILFGASQLGIRAKKAIEEDREVKYFCDNDSLKIGQLIENVEVISFEKLKEIYHNYDIIITSQYYREISKQLNAAGISKFEVFYHYAFNPMSKSIKVPRIKEINLFEFLSKVPNLTLPNISFITHSCGILDYTFLQALVKHFKLKVYLEIGSFIGESVSSVIDFVDKAYSITLPDDEVEWYFDKVGKENFSTYLINENKKVFQYKCNSRDFNFKKIKEKLDIVFIDGDHTYLGVYHDTKNIFSHIDKDHTIVVWHDYKTSFNYRQDVVFGIYDALGKEIKKNIFSVDNNLCGIYIPDKYLSEFSFESTRNKLYTYKIDINPNESYYEK